MYNIGIFKALNVRYVCSRLSSEKLASPLIPSQHIHIMLKDDIINTYWSILSTFQLAQAVTHLRSLKSRIRQCWNLVNIHDYERVSLLPSAKSQCGVTIGGGERGDVFATNWCCIFLSFPNNAACMAGGRLD